MINRMRAFQLQSQADDFGSEVKVRRLFYSAIIHFNARLSVWGIPVLHSTLQYILLLFYRPYGFNCLHVQRTDFEFNT